MTPVVLARITEEPISLNLADELATPSDGAIVCFVGTVRAETDGRAVTALEYEAYKTLAEDQLRELGEQACARWGLGAALLVHRVGYLEVGEPSVLVAACAPHRDSAFDACRALIDDLKRSVAIWKKEVFADGGSRWVEHA